MRKSIITKSDCYSIQKMTGDIQDCLLRYVGSGCPETGLNNDFMLMISLITLKNRIEEIEARQPKA